MISPKHKLVGNSNMIASRLSLFLLLACSCSINLGYVAKPVLAANTGIPRTSTVRPIRTKNSPLSPRPRLPFISSRNSRRAAKKAYLVHLQNELESAQRQLYVSQNTCNSLRTRWEDQKQESLQQIARKANQEQVELQEEEINQLQGKLQSETEKYEHQVERLKLLSEELKELQVWKEEEEQSNERKISQYEEQLQESNQKQSDYAEQVQLLALKLEASEFAAKQNQRLVEGGDKSSWERRAQELRSELETVRGKYSKMLVKSIQASSMQEDESSTGQQHQIELEMDEAIGSALESALGALEKDWETRYETLEDQLRNMTDYVTSLEGERDAAVLQVEIEVSSSYESEEHEEQPKLMEAEQTRLREELTVELMGTLTDELTEKLTNQLTETLTENLEKDYKKKLKRLHKELKEQQEKASEQEQSHKDVAQHQQQMIDAEVEKAKEQYQLEHQAKLEELQKQSEERVQFQKEKMRKLVKACLEREAKQKEAKDRKKHSSPKKKKKKSEASSDSEAVGAKGDDKELIIASSFSSSRKKNRPRPGVVPVRGGNR